MYCRRPSVKRWEKFALLVAFVGSSAALELGCGQPQEQQPPPSNSNAVTLADFRQRADNYAELHRKLSEQVGPLDGTLTPTEIAAREHALGQTIGAARASAKQGDIFTPATAALFRGIIREEFAHRSRLALEDREEAQDELPNFTPAVNQIYPTTYPLATFPPGVLSHLPPLPPPLEYRFVQRFLILRDIEANLIVDVLPEAAPTMNELKSSRGSGG